MSLEGDNNAHLVINYIHYTTIVVREGGRERGRERDQSILEFYLLAFISSFLLKSA